MGGKSSSPAPNYYGGGWQRYGPPRPVQSMPFSPSGPQPSSPQSLGSVQPAIPTNMQGANNAVPEPFSGLPSSSLNVPGRFQQMRSDPAFQAYRQNQMPPQQMAPQRSYGRPMGYGSPYGGGSLQSVLSNLLRGWQSSAPMNQGSE